MTTAASQRSAILRALREAGDDGVDRTDLLFGGNWLDNRLAELRREGVVIAEDQNCLVLVHDPDVGRASDTATSPVADDKVDPPLSVTGSSSTLFELPPKPHYEDEAA